MSQGKVIGIFIAPAGAAPLYSVSQVRAVPGQGLEGDRYFTGNGSFVKPGKLAAGQQCTLIESEAIEALRRECGIGLQPGQSRRNIVTQGIALNHLVGREFTVGSTRMKGVKLAEPCGHLEKLTQQGVRDGLIHRGGLRAQILTEGVICVGDPILADEPATTASRETAACAS